MSTTVAAETLTGRGGLQIPVLKELHHPTNVYPIRLFFQQLWALNYPNVYGDEPYFDRVGNLSTGAFKGGKEHVLPTDNVGAALIIRATWEPTLQHVKEINKTILTGAEVTHRIFNLPDEAGKLVEVVRCGEHEAFSPLMPEGERRISKPSMLRDAEDRDLELPEFFKRQDEKFKTTIDQFLALTTQLLQGEPQ